jgi:hypothetical protein
MAKPAKPDRVRLLDYRVKRLTSLLQGFDVKVYGLRIDEATGGKPYLQCTVKLSDSAIPFRFPLDKLGRRFERELWRLDKACYCGTVKPEDVKTLFIALSTPPNIYKHRTKLRQVTGLIKDEKLRNYLIHRRTRAKEMVEKAG